MCAYLRVLAKDLRTICVFSRLSSLFPALSHLVTQEQVIIGVDGAPQRILYGDAGVVYFPKSDLFVVTEGYHGSGNRCSISSRTTDGTKQKKHFTALCRGVGTITRSKERECS